MISIDLPATLEKHLREIVQDSYGGNLQATIAAFLKLHQKYGWKEQLLEGVDAVHSEVRRTGGIKAEAIDRATKR